MTLLILLAAAHAADIDAGKADWSLLSALVAARAPLADDDGGLSGAAVGAVQDDDGDLRVVTWSVEVSGCDDASDDTRAATKGGEAQHSLDSVLHAATRGAPAIGDVAHGLLDASAGCTAVRAVVDAVDTVSGIGAIQVADAAAITGALVWSDDGTISGKEVAVEVGATVWVKDGQPSVVATLAEHGTAAASGLGWGARPAEALGAAASESWFDDAAGGLRNTDAMGFADFIEENSLGDAVSKGLGFLLERAGQGLDTLMGNEDKGEDTSAIAAAQDGESQQVAAAEIVADGPRADAAEDAEERMTDATNEAAVTYADSEESKYGDDDSEDEGEDEDERSYGDDFEGTADAASMAGFVQLASLLGVDPHNVDKLGEQLGLRGDTDEEVDVAVLSTSWMEYACQSGGPGCLLGDEDDGAVYAEAFVLNMLCESGLCVGAGVGGELSKAGLAAAQVGPVDTGDQPHFVIAIQGE